MVCSGFRAITHCYKIVTFVCYCYRVQVLVFQIPEDVTTRSLAMAMLSDVRMIQQNRIKQAAAAALSLTSSHGEFVLFI